MTSEPPDAPPPATPPKPGRGTASRPGSNRSGSDSLGANRLGLTRPSPLGSARLSAPWPDIPPLVDGTAPGRLTRNQVHLWSLVLRARRVPHRVRNLAGGYTVQVPERYARQAVDEIRLYLEENISPHPSIPLPPVEERSRATMAAMLGLCAFFILSHKPWPGLGLYPHFFSRLGGGDAEAILSGQWWRLFTALTLHADEAHITSNAVIGGVFLILLSRRLDSGAAWLLAVLAGALGNLLNALVQGPGHHSVGFSTAVFGAAGALAGLKAVSGEGHLLGGNALKLARGKGWLLPVAAALALVASLGTAGENTDIGAHFFGLFAGGVLGLGAGLAATRLGYPNGTLGEARSERVNLWCGGLAVALLAGAWLRAWMLG